MLPSSLPSPLPTSIPASALDDPLSIIEAEEMIGVSEMLVSESVDSEIIQIETANEASEKTPFVLAFLRSKLLFLGHYLAVSTGVFFLLLGIANYSAYSTLVWNWISPESVRASENLVIDTLGKSRITVYAEEYHSGSNSQEGDIEAEEIKKKLEASNVVVRENLLSPRKLVPAKPQIKADFDIVPYENRIIVPKIGKNIPLVDVEPGNNFDFDHMENIFMKELEKGIIRYPGTARPGDTGNAFIFGHSSNYPWMPGQYNQVFALLDKLSFGDEIIVYYNQKKYVYIIREKKIVKPGDVKVLNRDKTKKELSLMTCWPIGTTLKRMIVFAELQTTPDTSY